MPNLELEETKGLSDVLLHQLNENLKFKAEELKGEVMIFELATTVQSFLYTHNYAPRGSFYDEMVMTNLKRDMARLKMKQDEEEKKRKIIKSGVEKRREELKKETRNKYDISKVRSETSSSQESSDSSNVIEANHQSKIKNQCFINEHQRSEILYFPSVGKKIQKGRCLNHSQKGCVAFSGIDLETGNLVYITEWNLKYSHLQRVTMNPDEVIESEYRLLRIQVIFSTGRQ